MNVLKKVKGEDFAKPQGENRIAEEVISSTSALPGALPRISLVVLIEALSLCLLLAALFAPLASRLGDWEASSTLGGQTTKAATIDLSLSSFLSRKYQQSLTEALRRNLPLRGKLIRTVNQIQYSLFGVMSTRSNVPLRLGKDNMLFEESYIHAYNRVAPLPEEAIQALVKSVADFQQALARHNIQFLLVIAPSKAAFYPDHLPPRLIRSDRNERTDDLELFLRHASAADINLFNTIPFLKGLASESKYPIFPKGGIHWSYFASCHVSAEIAERVGQLLGKQLGAIPCSPVRETTRAKFTDNDILMLANIWDNSPFSEVLAYPDESMQFSWDDYHPEALIVGDSFSWMPLHYFDKHGTFLRRKFYYYFNTQTTSWIVRRKNGGVKRRAGARRRFNRATMDWQNDLFSRDVVIFFVNQRALDLVGHDFIQHAMPMLEAKTPNNVLSNS